MDDSLCDQDEVPPRAQVCFLACPDDCVTTPWGAWSNCPLVRSNYCVLSCVVSEIIHCCVIKRHVHNNQHARGTIQVKLVERGEG